MVAGTCITLGTLPTSRPFRLSRALRPMTEKPEPRIPRVVRPISTETDRTARVTILDAAEQVFGTHGFDGGSMREIAQLAGISQSLLHYHYESKASLYEAIFERRAEVIRQVRQAKLEGLFDRRSEASLEEVLH